MSLQPLNQLLDLTDQVVIITGANRGIGKTTAQVLHAVGANVGLAARSSDSLTALCEELLNQRPNSALAVTTDVAEEAQVNQLVDRVMAAWGRVDILVNNAGLVSPGSFDEIDPVAWQRIMNVNLTGAYLCCRAVAPIMQRQRHGRIINIASISA
ncbi:SDR family oxidoreductase [Chloroflexi bacterium TSY]|nr:SDR family oxidoreductase [Chloroflexi bacterium TSY]